MKKQFSALIVDDERLSRKELKSMLSEYENIKIVGEVGDVPSAIKAIGSLNPEVIFLDIQMPGESGFDLLEKIEINAKIIFVTAYDEYALRAFDVNALDYLLKPINPQRLKTSIEKLEHEEEKKPQESKKLSYDDRLLIMINTHLKFLKINTILHISSAGDYTEIVTLDGTKGLALKSMNEWEARLPENYFCRIHRSSIVNMEYIEKLEEWFNNTYRVFIKGFSEPLVMSRRYVTKLKGKMA